MATGYRLGAEALRQIANLIRRMNRPREGRRARSGFARREAKIVRTATAYTTITAATATQPGVGEALLDKIRTDNRTFAEAEAIPVTVYNLAPTIFLPGTRLKLGRDQTAFSLDGNQRRQHAVWVVAERVGGAADITEIKVGRTTAPTQSFTAAGTIKVGWANTRTRNNDSSVFEQAHGPGNIWEYITLKAAGRYRIHYRLNCTKQSTGTVDEILSLGSNVVRLRGGMDTVIEDGFDTGDMPAINDIGTPRSTLSATTVDDFQANDQIRIDLTFAGSDGNNREVFLAGGAFIVTRTQEA